MTTIDTQELIKIIGDASKNSNRIMVAIAGAPASGKSTIADVLKEKLGQHAYVLPMDGFHLDNETLTEQGLLHRKGAPNTFDVTGFVQLVKTVKSGNEDIPYPTFDRSQDAIVPNSGIVPKNAKIIIIEGNYLLLNQENWINLSPLWDISISIDVPEETLRERLIERWLYYGLSPDDAIKRAESNDLKNMKTIIEQSSPADYILK